jgi:lysozyme
LNRADAKAKVEALGLDFDKVKNGTQEITYEHIMQLYDADANDAIAYCKAVFPAFEAFDDVRQRVLVDMMFNLGKPKFVGFKKMIAAVMEKNFEKAADEMKNSKWYKQVGERGKTLESMMRSGIDPAWLTNSG